MQKLLQKWINGWIVGSVARNTQPTWSRRVTAIQIIIFTKYFCHGNGEKVMDFDGKKTVYTQYTYQCKSHGDMDRKGEKFCQAEVVMLSHMISTNDNDMYFRLKA